MKMNMNIPNSAAMYWRIIIECSVVHHIRSHAEGHSLGICPEKHDDHHHHHHHDEDDEAQKSKTSQGQGWRAVQYGGRLRKNYDFISWFILACHKFVIGL